MAGYMTKLQGYLFEGEQANGTGSPVENGSIVVPGMVEGELKMILPAEDTDTKLLCKEVTTIYDGVVAYRFAVNAVGKNNYLVENGFEADTNQEYNLNEYTTAAGALLRAHPLQVGEEFVTDKVTGAPAVGSEYGVKADGTIG